MGKVIPFKRLADALKTGTKANNYQQRIDAMDKLELLAEMVRYQEWRSSVGYLTRDMIFQGIILFRALEAKAETIELEMLCRSYRRHLEYERDNVTE